MTRYLAESSPMPLRTALLYLRNKHAYETRLNNYFADMLWAPATGRLLKNAARYAELCAPKAEQDPRSGDQILTGLLERFKGKKITGNG